MTNKTIFYTLLLLFSFSMTSCVSNRSMQTARTTLKGDAGGGLGGSIIKANYFDSPDSTNIGGFAGEAFARFGIAEKLDVGVNLSMVGTSGLDFKYQFIGDQESAFAASYGGGVGFFSIESNGVNTTTIDATLPTYFSFHAGDALALYASPRVVQRFSSDNGTFLGLIGGTRIGLENFAIFIEYGVLKSYNDSYDNHKQFNIGVAKGIQ